MRDRSRRERGSVDGIKQVAFAEQFTRGHDLSLVGRDSEGEPVSLRELLVHMIEEYARHNGHQVRKFPHSGWPAHGCHARHS